MKDEKKKPKQDLRVRTREFALRIIRLYKSLPKTTEAQVIGRQLLKAGTSPGAQYREAQRAKSNPDFITKIEGALQELDESNYWMELLMYSQITPEERLQALVKECNELIAIFVSIVTTIKAKEPPKKLRS